MNGMKQTLKVLARRSGYDIRRIRHAEASRGSSYSHLSEETIIRRHLDRLDDVEPYCVDIGASDGMFMSNTLALFQAGWHGLAAEADPILFSRLADRHASSPVVRLFRGFVTPENVVNLLHSANTPQSFGFLSLDIDGYDSFVLDAILEVFRPALLCCEINESIPPPLDFTVRYDPEHFWAGGHFFGQSLTHLQRLGERHDYVLTEVHYNNTFLVPRERAKTRGLAAREGYNQGYVERPDRRQLFPQNADMEDLLSLPPEEALQVVAERFSQYEGQFDLSLAQPDP